MIKSDEPTELKYTNICTRTLFGLCVEKKIAI